MKYWNCQPLRANCCLDPISVLIAFVTILAGVSYYQYITQSDFVKKANPW
jgi:hypothetical protein